MTPPSRTLRIALLGADSSTPALARAVVDRYQLAGICEFDGADPETIGALAPLVSRARKFADWEALLDQQVVDAVIVARGPDEDRRAEQLRKLVQAGVPLLVSHPVVDSMLIYYELDMIRRDTACVVVPNLPDRHHRAIEELAEILGQGAGSPIGKIEQVVVQSCIAEPRKPQVIARFAREVDLIRSIAGDMTRLGAMAGTSDDAAYASLGVQMAGPSGVAVRWSVNPVQTDETTQISLLGANGRAVLDIHSDGQPWTMELIMPGGQVKRQQYEIWDSASAALSELERAIVGAGREPDWVDAARSIELAETIERSLKKSRTIELYYEDYTEEGTFKGTMTSVGCGLLLAGMFLLGAVAIAEQMGLPYVRAWPYLLLGFFGLFLLMQMLMLVFRKQEPGSSEAPLPNDQRP